MGYGLIVLGIALAIASAYALLAKRQQKRKTAKFAVLFLGLCFAASGTFVLLSAGSSPPNDAANSFKLYNGGAKPNRSVPTPVTTAAPQEQKSTSTDSKALPKLSPPTTLKK